MLFPPGRSLSLTTCLLLLSTSALTSATCNHPFKPPGATDLRGPCPVINSLANHGFLPRSGTNVSRDALLAAFANAFNVDPVAITGDVDKALTTSTTGNPNTVNLDDMSQHGVIEHDGSLSRADIFFGDNQSFNKTIWDETKSFFGNPSISIAQAAQARATRLQSAAAINPEFNLTEADTQNSLVETAFYMRLFSNGTQGNANTQWVNVLFEQERIPFAEGFVRSNSTIVGAEVEAIVSLVQAATPTTL